jgi:hypothetical protein
MPIFFRGFPPVFLSRKVISYAPATIAPGVSEGAGGWLNVPHTRWRYEALLVMTIVHVMYSY